MRSPISIPTLILAGLAAVCSQPNAAADFQFGAQTFSLPDGFVLERIAGPPLVDRPISGSFDERGYFYVTDSSGSNDKPQTQLDEKPHRIMRLEDTDGDGVFDKSIVFADKMMFPEGCLYYRGSLYVSAPPSIWKLTDTDGDGAADQREEWHQGETLTGCANDLHGPYLGPDGWLYWGKGAFAEQNYHLPTGDAFSSRASHILRKRLNGSGFEPVMTGGMDNPVGIAFSSSGDCFLAGTFFVHPGAGNRDGILHAIYGGVYGKDHGVLDGHKRTGDLMPIMTHMGSAAPADALRYESTAFGPDFQNDLFVSAFNLNRVTRHQLRPRGATFETIDSDFLTCDSMDFHPTDAIEDADGSLVIIDTGGWYKLCCPTSQLWKPDVLGAIYRIKKVDHAKIDDPRGANIPWKSTPASELVKRLGDVRPAVRERAIEELALRGESSVPPLSALLATSSTPSPRMERTDGTIQRLNAVWALCRIDAAASRKATTHALMDPDESVRLAAIHAAGLWRDTNAAAPLISNLMSSNARIARASAEALGRLGETTAAPHLLEACRGVQDRVLFHSLAYALIELNEPSSVRSGLESDAPSIQRLALTVLDQLGAGELSPIQAANFLGADDPELQSAARWVISHHVEWGDELGPLVERQLASSNISRDERARVEELMSALANNATIQAVVSALGSNRSRPIEARLSALRIMNDARLQKPPGEWLTAIETCLDPNTPELCRLAISALNRFPADSNPASINQELLRIASSEEADPQIRLEAAAAITPRAVELSPALFEFVVDAAAFSQPSHWRSKAAEVLAEQSLSPTQLRALLPLVKEAHPLNLPRILEAYRSGQSEELGMRLIQSLADSNGAAVLSEETLEPILKDFPAAIQERADQLLDSWKQSSEEQRERLETTLAALPEGDIRRGQELFNSSVTACSSCHSIGYLGGKLGPDLTRIGQVRAERDLLEAVMFPSASFVRSYEPWILATADGELHSGILRSESADEIVLATGPTEENRFSKSQVKELRLGTTSVMPGGLDEALSKQQLADLVAFLKATRW